MPTTNSPSGGEISASHTPAPAETWMLMASLVFDNRGMWRSYITERTDMPFSRFRALRRLETAPLTASALAERLDVDAAATSVIVTDLVARGLVTKQADPDDGRRKILSITPAGRDLLADARAHAEAPALIHALSDDERTTLHSLLTTMQEHTA